MAVKVKAETNGHDTNGVVNRIADKLPEARSVVIPAPNEQFASFKIRGTSPYVQNRFSEKARKIMEQTQAEGSTAKGKKKRSPKDFTACFKEATYLSAKGEFGIPCAAFRQALVSACKIVGFAMTRAKLAFFVQCDIRDANDNTGLVKITKGKPKEFHAHARNDNGSIDIRSRPMWDEGWEATVVIKFDGDMFTVVDVANLIARVGKQVGVGEGRADSKDSCGQGWGFFEVVNK